MLQKNIGIIGCGSMGKMLLRGFFESGLVEPHRFYVSSRTGEKLLPLQKAFPGIHIAASNTEAASAAALIVLCVKGGDYKSVLTEITGVLNEQKHLVSIAGAVSVPNLEKMFTGKISRIMPTVLSEVKLGVTLVCHNSGVLPDDKKTLEELLNTMGTVKYTTDEQMGHISELTSCAPGFFAALFREFVNTAADFIRIDPDEIKQLVIRTLYGTAKLLYESDPDFDTLINRVATKGGITEEGVNVFADKLPQVYSEMFERTLAKRVTNKQKIDALFI